MTKTFDSITLEIIQSSLQAISDEMFAAMRKTAMSAIIYEVLDMGTGITDAKGNLASSGAGIPSFVGVLDKAVRRILEIHSTETIESGAIFATNDPYYGGVTHLNDVVLAMPVFAGDEIIAWTANIAHWNDIGGMVPGSMSTEATEIYQEGLRLPAVKLIAKGEPIKSVMNIMKANSRLPDFLQGDMWAGIAAVRLGERRLQEILRKYGEGAFGEALERYMDYGEKLSLAGLRNLPKGRFSLEEKQDDGVTYKVTVENTGTEFIVDLQDNPDQTVGPLNVSRDGAVVAVQMIFKAVTNSDRQANAGTFRPLKVLTRPGSVFHIVEPAATGFYFEVRMRLNDLIWRCLAQAIGNGALPAGHFASICTTVVSGPHPDTGRHFTIVEPQVGGWGAFQGGDGNSALFTNFHGETYNCPAEVAETRYGLYVDQLKLNEEPGGEGEFRGGRGVVLDYRVRSDGCTVTCGYGRSKHGPWALNGGREGSPNYVEILRKTGEKERYALASAIPVDRDDVIRLHTGSGGGYGDPKQRSKDRLRDDRKNGYMKQSLDRTRTLR
jgi:N-methylhydantoinase B